MSKKEITPSSGATVPSQFQQVQVVSSAIQLLQENNKIATIVSNASNGSVSKHHKSQTAKTTSKTDLKGIIGQQMEIKTRQQEFNNQQNSNAQAFPPQNGSKNQSPTRVIDTIRSSQETSQNNENPLNSYLETSSNDTGSKGSRNKSVIMKINVQSPQIRNLELPGKFEKSTDPINILESSREQLRSEETNQGEMDQIRDKLCQSSLNKVFGSPGNESPINSDINSATNCGEEPVITVQNLKRPSNESNIVFGVILQDWKPVVCRQTQKFLHSNDDSQKSEYKNFAGNNILRSKKSPAYIPSQQKRQTSKQSRPQNLQELQQQVESKQLQNSNRDVNKNGSQSPSKANVYIHINQIEFRGGACLNENNLPIQKPESQQDDSSKYISHVTLPVQQQNKQQPLESSFKGAQGIFREPILLNSNSETAGSQLIHNESEVTHSLIKQNSNEILSQKKPFQQTQKKILQKQTSIDKIVQNSQSSRSRNSPVKQTFSHINIDHSVLDVGGRQRSQESQRSSKVVKVPNIPNTENHIDFLTEKSAGSIDHESNSKNQSQKLKFDAPSKIMNKTAITSGQGDLKPFLAMASGVTCDKSTPRASQKNIEDRRQIIKKEKSGFARPAGGIKVCKKAIDMSDMERSTSNNEDLMHLVKPTVNSNTRAVDRMSTNRSQADRSPFDRSQVDRSVENATKLNNTDNTNTLYNQTLTQSPTINADNTPKQSEQKKLAQVTKFLIDASSEQNSDATRNQEKLLKEQIAEEHTEERCSLASIDNQIKKIAAERNSSPRRTILQTSNQKSKSPQSRNINRNSTNQQMMISSKNMSTSPTGIAKQASFEKQNEVEQEQKSEALQYLYNLQQNRQKWLRKQEAINRAKHKALEERLQNIIEFKSEPEQLMIVSPAPTKPKIADNKLVLNSPTQVSGDFLLQQSGFSRMHNLSQELDSTSDHQNSVFLQLSRRYVSPSPVPLQPGQLELTNMTQTITDEHTARPTPAPGATAIPEKDATGAIAGSQVPSQPDFVADKHRHASSDNVVQDQQSNYNSNNNFINMSSSSNTIKVRRFEFGGQHSQRLSTNSKVGLKGGVRQQPCQFQPAASASIVVNNANVTGAVNDFNQTPGGKSSIYNEERLSPPIKFTFNETVMNVVDNDREQQINTQKRNHLESADDREKHDMTELINKQSSAPATNNMNASNERHLNSITSNEQLTSSVNALLSQNSQITVIKNNNIIQDEANNKKQQLVKPKLNQFEILSRDLVNTSQTVIRQLNQQQNKSNQNTVEKNEKFAKTSHGGFQCLNSNLMRQSMSRKYAKIMNSSRDNSQLSKQKSMHVRSKKGGRGATAAADDPIFDTYSDETKYGHKSNKKSIAHCSIDGSQVSDQQLKPVNNKIKVVELSHVPVKTNFKDFPGLAIKASSPDNTTTIQSTQREQMEKYLRMTSFIDCMFKKNSKGNPVYQKNKNAQMKKHEGWNKVLMGFKTHAQMTPVGSPRNLLASPRHLDKVNDNKRLQMETRRSQPVQRSQLIKKTSRNIHNQSSKKQQEEYLNTTSACLHPFKHSLVNHNINKLSENIQLDASLLDDGSPRTKEQREKIFTQTLNSLNDQLKFESKFDDSFYPVSPIYDDNNQPTLQLTRNKFSTSFNERSYLSPAPPIRPVQINDSYSKLEKAQSSRQDIFEEKLSSVFQVHPLGTPQQQQMQNEDSRFMRAVKSDIGPSTSSTQITNLVSCGDNVIAMLMDLQHNANVEAQANVASPKNTTNNLPITANNPTSLTSQQQIQPPQQQLQIQTENSNTNNVKLCQTTASLTSPLMDKSRQNSLSNVYKQLHQGGKTQRNWDLLSKAIMSQRQKSQQNHQVLGLRRITRNVASGAGAPTSSLNHPPQTLRSDEDQLNVDLVRDGATSIHGMQIFQPPSEEMGDVMKSNRNLRNMRLPPVQTKPMTGFNDDTKSNGVESPLLDSIFPPVMMSPKQNQQFASRSVFKPFQASKTRMHGSNARQSVKKKLTNAV